MEREELNIGDLARVACFLSALGLLSVNKGVSDPLIM